MLLLNPLPQRLDSGATPTFAGLLAGDGTAAAPSISFAADSDTGFYRLISNGIGISLGGAVKGSFQDSGGIFFQANSGSLFHFLNAGQILITAAGTAQNIVLSPSTTGFVSVESGANPYNGKIQFGSALYACYISNEASSSGAFAINGYATIIFRTAGVDAGMINSSRRFLLGTATDSGALLQIGTDTTTNAGGIVLGTNIFLFRSAANVLTIQASSGTACAGGFVSNLFTNGSGATMFFGTSTADSVILRTNNTAALTLDSSQNSTFAGWIKPRLATTAGAPAYVKGAIYFDTTLNKLCVGGATAWETVTSV
jgi:hypothetical protein